MADQGIDVTRLMLPTASVFRVTKVAFSENSSKMLSNWQPSGPLCRFHKLKFPSPPGRPPPLLAPSQSTHLQYFGKEEVEGEVADGVESSKEEVLFEALAAFSVGHQRVTGLRYHTVA